MVHLPTHACVPAIRRLVDNVALRIPAIEIGIFALDARGSRPHQLRISVG